MSVPTNVPAGRAMRILIRNSGSYWQASGEWGDSRTDARNFFHTTAAYWFALEQKFIGVEILMAFPDEKWDFVAART
jgi:hypothetical protein